MKRKDLTGLELDLLHEMACFCSVNEKEFIVFLKGRESKRELRAYRRFKTNKGGNDLIGKVFQLGYSI